MVVSLKQLWVELCYLLGLQQTQGVSLKTFISCRDYLIL